MKATQIPIQLARRVIELPSSSTLAVTARVRELKAEGKNVIGFGAGEPDFDTPAPIGEAAIDALRAGQTHYMPVPGDPQARQVIAGKLQRENGIDCTGDDIVITVGGKHAMYLALQALVDPGDEVIVPTPAWVSYVPMVQLCGGAAVQVPAAVENDFRITADQLAAALTPRTKAMLFNSPSNPCGTMYSPEEIRALADVVAAHDRVVLISDEIYEKIIYGGIEHLSPGSLDALAGRVVTLNGMSKAFAMTGWRIGYACAPIPEPGGGAVARAIAKLQGQMTSHITSFTYAAIIEALSHRADDVETMRKTFAQRAELMYNAVSAMPGIVCPRPTGAFYVFPDVSAHFGRRTPGGRTVDSCVAFAQALLDEALVAVVPGDGFGECGRAHVRLSFACGNEDIEEGCRRMREWIEKLD
ncbi:MAG: pyridoxal phosphate-dependent aminotransferase [Planctomycetota bacterium]|nr:pyridoxal phosphate-dependent aminotransferase [Planctomycetota bacterium]